MLLRLMTSGEVAEHLRRSTGIILPTGSTEQHGPNGLLGTDHVCAEEIARGVGEVCSAIVAPTLNVGMSIHHLGFPGTVSLTPQTLLAVLEDWVRSLHRHGFTHFFFINGHGGNNPALLSAFINLQEAHRLRCLHVDWWTSEAVAALAQEKFGDGEGHHATPSEISVAMHFWPQQHKKLDHPPRRGEAKLRFFGSRDFRRRYPDGCIMSDPSLATPELGRQFYETAVKSISEMYREFIAEPVE